VSTLKAGDRVYLDGSTTEGIVKEVHPHEALVRVEVSGGHEERRFALESLRLDPTMDEATGFIDH